MKDEFDCMFRKKGERPSLENLYSLWVKWKKEEPKRRLEKYYLKIRRLVELDFLGSRGWF